ncbi:natural killer cells antigen CD94-like [Stylophora pistillata]|uniref:natural killer cells antigen CD94-like n=1 Tax=Stylophora pistillata TaxID=50429 RepID=UPI000C03D958|nr:natural killer cells antigen CD94-like [Stylophora pistillata]
MMSGTICSKMSKTMFILSVLATQTSAMQLQGGDTNNTCFRNSCYSFKASLKTWNESRSFCRKQGGDLVSIETEEEWMFIKEEIENYREQQWYIGLVRESGIWTWGKTLPRKTTWLMLEYLAH